MTALPLALALSLAAPQSAGPAHSGYDPRAARLSPDAYEGEFGELLRAIEGDIRCSCGCGLDLHSCQFQMQCAISPGWSRRIMSALQQGETPEAIRAGFVADFGPTVLMAPPPEGFNLLGYLLPGLAILFTGALVSRRVRGSALRAGGADGASSFTVPEVSAADEDRLARELRKIEEMERPDW